jgi:hypothetical protein
MTKLARALSIKGWMSEPELIFLAQVANASKKIAEVGCYCGRSTRAMADNSKATIHAIDPWDGAYQVYNGITHYNGDNETLAMFDCNLYDHISSGRVIVNRMKFSQFDGRNFDFIFLDAIHEYAALKADIYHAEKMIPRGVLAGHDYDKNWPGVIEAVDEMFPDRKVYESIWYVELF